LNRIARNLVLRPLTRNFCNTSWFVCRLPDFWLTTMRETDKPRRMTIQEAIKADEMELRFAPYGALSRQLTSLSNEG
jgi:hypothetical protein